MKFYFSRNQLFLVLFCIVFCFGCNKKTENVEWIETTIDHPWVKQSSLKQISSDSKIVDVKIQTTEEQQTIDGFGTCFNELGWTSLSLLNNEDREKVMEELFAPGKGANLSICRMPVGANDFSLDWYSYNETEGDFEMKNFSIAEDEKTLIPFIKNAQKYNPNIKLWASPWCPPSWMKYNKNYACRSSILNQNSARQKDHKYWNNLPPDKEGHEGTDMFIQEDKYFKAYALYFSKFIDAYKAHGINIFAVMPQNEFNSAQVFPSCCWTAAGLNKFIGSYLGPAMEEKNVDVYFGTMERPTELLVDTILQDPKSSKYVKGVGFQWAGKKAIPGIHKRYPNLILFQTEQECGNGKNDWKGAMHSWDLMKHYLNNGVSVYDYWNTSLIEGGISHWGWAQNSLVIVDSKTKTFKYSPEYYIMKHVSHYVLHGAKKLKTVGKDKDVLAFKNKDGSVAVIIANQKSENKQISIEIDDKSYSFVLKPNSINTMVFNGNVSL